MAEKTNTVFRETAPHGSPPSNDANAQIASKLQELYDSVREEAIPDRFLDLLEKLDEVEQKSSRAASK